MGTGTLPVLALLHVGSTLVVRDRDSRLSDICVVHVDRGAAKHSRKRILEPPVSVLEVLRVKLHANTIAAAPRCRNLSRSRPHKWIEDSIADKTEHPDQALGEFNWIWCWVFARRRASKPRPDLLEPLMVILR